MHERNALAILLRRIGEEKVAREIDVLPKFDKFRQKNCAQIAMDNISAANNRKCAAEIFFWKRNIRKGHFVYTSAAWQG